MKVVVTGGAGFIGANLCRQLAGRREVTDVIAFDNLSTGDRENLADVPGVTLVEGDICDQGAVAEVITGAHSVVHLAARPSVPKSMQDPMASHLANATGTVAVLEAMRAEEVTHLVLASSSSVYGANPTLPKSEDLKPAPISPYGASKLAAESYALAYAPAFGFEVLAFRFFNVFGPLQPAGHAYAAVIPTFISAALEGRPLPVHGTGLQTRDFTYVDSVTSVICEAVQRRLACPDPVNLAFGTRVTLQHVISIIEDVMGHPIEQEAHPERPGDVRDSQADTTRLRTLVPGVEPVELRAGIEATVEWLRSRHPDTDGASRR